MITLSLPPLEVPSLLSLLNTCNTHFCVCGNFLAVYQLTLPPLSRLHPNAWPLTPRPFVFSQPVARFGCAHGAVDQLKCLH